MLLLAMASDIALATLVNTLNTLISHMSTMTNQPGTTSAAGGSIIDTRGVGTPEKFSGKEEEWQEWRYKVVSYLKAARPQIPVKDILEWAETQTTPVNDTIITEVCSRDSYDERQIIGFSNQLHTWLTSWARGPSMRYVMASQCGLEAWRSLNARYQPKSAGSKRNVLLKMLTMKGAKTPTELENQVLKLDDYIRLYEQISTVTLPDDIKAAILISVCPEEVRQHFDLTDDLEKSHREMREGILGWVQRRRERDPKALAKLEVGNHGGDAMEVDMLNYRLKSENALLKAQLASVDWGDQRQLQQHQQQWQPGETEDSWGNWPDNTGDGTYSMDGSTVDLNAVGKGKGPRGFGKGASKGKGIQKGKGYQKGSTKGKGLAKGGFQGECYQCGKWGHSARFCQQHQHAGKGSTNNLEVEEGQGPHELGGLEVSRHVIGNIEVKKDIVLRNRFQGLVEEHDEAGETKEDIELQRQVVEFPILDAQTQSHKKRMPRQRGSWKALEVNSMECEQRDIDRSKLVITIDSGAAESVLNESHAPKIPTRPSEQSRAGVEYVNANGATMPNKGEKLLPIQADNGMDCALRMQVTDVKRALLSVGKVCDSGHEVVFQKNGGWIRHKESGRVFNFARADGVYRMEVSVLNELGFKGLE